MSEEKKPSKLILLLPFIIFLSVLFMFWVSLGNEKSTELPSARLGKAVPAFKLSSLFDSQKAILGSQLKGPFLLNVWATWCPGCYQEHPFLLELKKVGVKLVGVNYKDERLKAIEFLNRLGDPFDQVVFDPDGDLGLDLGVYGAPETYFVDAKGIIQYRHVGVLSPQVWQHELSQIWQGLKE